MPVYSETSCNLVTSYNDWYSRILQKFFLESMCFLPPRFVYVWHLRSPASEVVISSETLGVSIHSFCFVSYVSFLDYKITSLILFLWKQVQWNLFIADILYSGHLSTVDTFLRNGWNPCETLITKPLCSGHFIADTSI